MIGKTLSHYRIISELGRGGMGIVYKAEDTKLGRTVALKFLAGHLTEDPAAKERFVREARAAAVLQHDSICAIHDVKESPDGTMYIVMPFYDGQTLGALMSHGPLDPERAIGFTQQILEGLRAAHAKKLIHRDIKPGNILITDGDKLKILDFGLAKLVGEVDLTLTSSTVGTMAYMSPEQIQNEPVDQRSDLWSLGVVFYEMLTGEKPFTGTYDAAVIYSIINQEVDCNDAKIPETLRAVLGGLLKKDRNKRIASADEALQMFGNPEGRTETFSSPSVVGVLDGPPVPLTDQPMIRWMLTGATALTVILLVLWRVIFTDPHSPINSEAINSEATESIDVGLADASATQPIVGVMYIENNSSRERLGFVLRDMLARNLGQVENIQVVSNQRLKDILRQETSEEGGTIDAATATRIARQAGITTMILGSVVQFGNEYILEAELTDVETGNIIDAVSAVAASESDIMQAVNELTAGILSGSGKITEGDNSLYRIEQVSTGTLTAYELYEKGLDDSDHWRFAAATENFRSAIAIDSTFISAYIGAVLASAALSIDPTDGLKESRTFVSAAKQNLSNATERDRRFIEALDASLYFPNDRRDIEGFRELAQKYPDDKEIQFMASNWLMDSTSYDYYNRLFELDPSNAQAYNGLAYFQLVDRRPDEAISTIRRYRTLQPGVNNTMDSAWEIMTGAGQETQAIEMLDAALDSGADRVEVTWRKMYTMAIAGDTSGTRVQLESYRIKTSEPDYLFPRRASHVALIFGQWDKARVLSAASLRAARRSQSDADLLIRLRSHAAVLHATGQHDQAEELLEEAVEISRQVYSEDFNPISVLAAYQNGLGYADLDDRNGLVGAIAELEKALEAPGLDRRHTSYLYLLRANLAVIDGDMNTAYDQLNFIQGTYVENITHSMLLRARIDGLTGNIEGALARYHLAEHAIHSRGFQAAAYPSFFRDHSLVLYETARMFDDRGDRAEAIRRYQAALERWKSVGADFRYIDVVRQRLEELGAGS